MSGIIWNKPAKVAVFYAEEDTEYVMLDFETAMEAERWIKANKPYKAGLIQRLEDS